MKISCWSLSSQTIAILTQGQGRQPINCRRKVFAPKGKLSQEVEISPAHLGIIIKRVFCLEIEDPDTTPFFSNNLVIDFNLGTGCGKLFFTIQEGQDRFYGRQGLKPPYVEPVPHPDVRTLSDFYQKRIIQTSGQALIDALQFILEKDQLANKIIPLHGKRDMDPLEAVPQALNKLLQQIIRLAEIELDQ